MASNDLKFPDNNRDGYERIQGQDITLKTIMSMEVRHQIKWKVGAAFNLIGRSPPILCPCEEANQRVRINQRHITHCLLFDPVWKIFAIDWNTNK
jgi:hypothetical protein